MPATPTTPKPGDDERVLRVSREIEHGRDEIIRGEYVERQEAAGRSFITMVSEDEIQLLRDTRAALTLPAPEAARPQIPKTEAPSEEKEEYDGRLNQESTGRSGRTAEGGKSGVSARSGAGDSEVRVLDSVGERAAGADIGCPLPAPKAEAPEVGANINDILRHYFPASWMDVRQSISPAPEAEALVTLANAWDEGSEAGYDHARNDHTPRGQSIDPPQNPYIDCSTPAAPEATLNSELVVAAPEAVQVSRHALVDALRKSGVFVWNPIFQAWMVDDLVDVADFILALPVEVEQVKGETLFIEHGDAMTVEVEVDGGPVTTTVAQLDADIAALKAKGYGVLEVEQVKALDPEPFECSHGVRAPRRWAFQDRTCSVWFNPGPEYSQVEADYRTGGE